MALPNYTTNVMPTTSPGYPYPTGSSTPAAATPAGQTADSAFGDILAGFNIYGNLQRGGVRGDVGAAAGASNLASKTGVFGANTGVVNEYAGDAANVLGIYSGLQRGGWQGDLSATTNAAQLAAREGILGKGVGQEVGMVAGDINAAYATYEAIKNWRSGSTGSDTIQGAEAGAAIGSAIPGVGTLVGAGVGAAVGAVSSMFGPGREDPENANWDSYAAQFDKGGAQSVQGATPSQNFQLLAGIFDARGSSIPFYGKYGRMGESKFTSDMTAQVNQAIGNGIIPKNATPDQIYSKVVEPWINSMSPGGWQDANTVKGAPTKAAVGNILTDFIGQWQTGQVTGQTPLGISGQTVSGIQAYKGGAPGSAASLPTAHSAFVGQPSSALPSTGATMATGLPNHQLNDPTAMNAIGANNGLPGYSTNTGGVPTNTGSSGGDGSIFSDPSFDASLIGGGIGILGAGYAQHQNNNAVAPITAAGVPFQQAGQQLLQQGMSGQLTPQQQQVVSTSQSQGQTMINAATPIGQIAQNLMKQYTSGNLKPADQAQIDQQTTAAKAQIAQALGPNVDSTTLATYNNQIDQQAAITKQNILNSYLATGNQEFDQWSTTTQEGQATILAGQQYAVTQIDNTFQKAFQASSLGSSNILAGIQQQMASNTNLANSFQSYMSNIAKAYALSKYTPGSTNQAPAGAGTGNPALNPTDTSSTPQMQTVSPYNITQDPGGSSSINDILNSPIDTYSTAAASTYSDPGYAYGN